MRLLGYVTKVNTIDMRMGRTGSSDFEGMTAASASLDRITISDLGSPTKGKISGSDIDSISNEVEEWALATEGKKIFMLDYLQLVSEPKGTKAQNREQVISQTARGCKLLTTRFTMPVIALS